MQGGGPLFFYGPTQIPFHCHTMPPTQGWVGTLVRLFTRISMENLSPPPAHRIVGNPPKNSNLPLHAYTGAPFAGSMHHHALQ